MRFIDFPYVALILSYAGCLPAAEVPENTAIAQQRQAVSQMEASVEVQRQTVRQQVRPPATGQSFFLSPPPAHGTLVPTHAAPVADCNPLPAQEVDSLIGQAAQREELDPHLLRGVMEQESAFRPCAVSPKGAMGLMQLMPATAAQLGVRDPFDPAQSVDAGARFLKQLLESYGGDMSLALGAYNAGSSRVNDANGIPLIPETMDYVKRILSLLPAQK